MKPHLSALNMTTFIAPVIACDEALLEVEFMRDTDLELLDCLKKVLSGEADERTEGRELLILFLKCDIIYTFKK